MNLRIAPILPLCSLLAAQLAAQAPPLTRLQQFDGVAAREAVGRCVASAGDVNADGYADIIIGGDWIDSTDRDAGRVFVYDGRALSSGVKTILYQIDGDSIGDFFGWSCDGAGDVDGDGYDDFVVGAYGDEPLNPPSLDTGSAFVYSGRTGQLLYHLTDPSPRIEARFGRAVSGAGDVNGDGYADIIVGAFSDDTVDAQGNVIFNDSGSATVFSGRDGSVLFHFEGSGPNQYAGFSVSGAGDVDGDGWDDVLVGVVGDNAVGPFAGTAVVLSYDPAAPSGLNYTELRRYNAVAAGDLQGSSVANAGDVDGDLVEDHIIGAVLGDPNGIVDAGAARVYSGATGALIRVHGGLFVNDLQGLSVDGAGDVNGDGYDDVIVGAILASGSVIASGRAYVFSGRDGAELANAGGDGIADAFGWSVAGAGDVDGDGLAEVLVGAPFADPNGLLDGGSAYLFDNVTPVLATPWRVRHIGAACAVGSGALPTVVVDGKPVVGRSLALSLRGAAANNVATLNIAAPQATPVPLGSLGFQPNCFSYVQADGFVVSTMTNAVGVAAKSTILIPNAPVFIGAAPVVQWFCADFQGGVPQVQGGYAFSGAVELTIGG